MAYNYGPKKDYARELDTILDNVNTRWILMRLLEKEFVTLNMIKKILAESLI